MKEARRSRLAERRKGSSTAATATAELGGPATPSTDGSRVRSRSCEEEESLDGDGGDGGDVSGKMRKRARLILRDELLQQQQQLQQRAGDFGGDVMDAGHGHGHGDGDGGGEEGNVDAMEADMDQKLLDQAGITPEECVVPPPPPPHMPPNPHATNLHTQPPATNLHTRIRGPFYLLNRSLSGP